VVVESHAVSSADGRSFLIVDLVFSLYRVLPLCKLLFVHTFDVVWDQGEAREWKEKMECFDLEMEYWGYGNGLYGLTLSSISRGQLADEMGVGRTGRHMRYHLSENTS